MLRFFDKNRAAMEKFVQEMLESHNSYRARHQAGPLKLSSSLTKQAQKWAEKLADKDKLEHDPQCQKDKIGENVAMKYNSATTDFPGGVFTDYWYSEVQDYKFDSGVPDQINCGHFTQVVWKASSEAGFGRAVAKSGRVYVVGRYNPAANYVGEFQKNVLPPADGKIVVPNTNQAGASGGGSSGSQPEPVIGPNDPADQLISTNVTTRTQGNKKTVCHKETYRTPRGDTYTKERETTTTVG